MGRFGRPPLWGLMFLPMLLFWALVIGGIVWLAFLPSRRAGVSPSASSGREAPLDVLKMRYAKGEITKEQFDPMKKDLE